MLQIMTQIKKIVLISVVIPCYGNLPQLLRSMDSIASQTLMPYEVLFVDDATGLIGQNVITQILSRQWPFKVRLFTLNKNIGAGPARNIGWDEVMGDYIAFLDADDIWHPEKLAQQINFMELHPQIGLSGHSHQLLSEGQSINKINLTGNFKFLSLFDILIQNPFITPSVVVRNSIYQRFNANQRHSEDYRLWLEIAFSGARVAKLSDPLAAIYKPLISSRGLSSNLVMMEYGEIRAYMAVALTHIKFYPLLILLIPYSFIKFIRRIMIRFFQELVIIIKSVSRGKS